MYQNLPFWAQKSKKIGRGIPRWGGGHTHPTPLGATALSASFLASAMIRSPLFKPWIRPGLIDYDSINATDLLFTYFVSEAGNINRNTVLFVLTFSFNK